MPVCEGVEVGRSGWWFQPVEEHSSTDAPQEPDDALLVGQRAASLAAGGRLLDLHDSKTNPSASPLFQKTRLRGPKQMGVVVTTLHK